jgi:pimeloyl-ACP methyl ester carboxylesterase
MTLSRMTRTSVVALCVLATVLFAVAPAANAQTQPVTPGTQGDFAGLVDIGGRKIYLECSGQGSPTVVFVAGGGSSARYWTDDLRPADPPRTMVFPRVATTTRVCAYDRPGTLAEVGKELFVSRSDPVPQPSTFMAAVTDLHSLLQAAGIPGPYILAGHSNGGFISRMYASTYPDEVVGMVLIDAYSEFLEPAFGPKLWPKLVKFNAPQSKAVQIPGYGQAETVPYASGDDQMRQLTKTSPLRPMPLAVLAHGRPFALPKDPKLSQGLTSKVVEPGLLKANQAQAKLVPEGRFFYAKKSGHDIHQDQPALTAEAIQQVVAGVRSPDTWYSLQTCCRT